MSKNSEHNRETSRHHLVPRSRGGANYPPNTEQTRNSTHQAIHTLFENELIIEKIDTIISLDEAVLKDYFKRIIDDILKMSPQDVYKIEAFKNSKSWRGAKNR